MYHTVRLCDLTAGHRTGLGLLLAVLIPLCALASTPKRVLILTPYGRDVAPFSAVDKAFRATLAEAWGGPVDIYEVPLDLGRFSAPDEQDPLEAFLAERLPHYPMDLVVPIAGAGVQFVARNRQRLFPDTPALVLAAEPRMIPPGFLQTNATLVTQQINLPGGLEDILDMQPLTTNIVVVFGSSPLEQFWASECRRQFQPFTNRVGFTWLTDLSFEDVTERCATLPPHSFIILGLFLVDANGLSCEQNTALLRLHEVANAPLFGFFESDFGLGTIGGRLFRDSEIGVQGAHVAVRILHGEAPEQIPPQVFDAATPVFDWRELHRWGIAKENLPAGSDIRFIAPSFWMHYRWLLAGTALLIVLQAALIMGLLTNRARRRQGEAEASLVASISSQFVNLAPGEVDQAIESSLRRICDFLRLDFAVLWQWLDVMPAGFMPTHSYSADPGLRPTERMNQEQYPWAREQLGAGRIVKLTSPDELPAEAARDRETLRQFGIRSNLAMPLSMGGARPFGILGFGTMRARRRWPDDLVNRLQLMSQIFANALARKRADEELRESEERLKLAAEAAEFGVWEWRIAANQVWGSERWLRLFGFGSAVELTLETVLERIHPVDRESVAPEVRQAQASGGNYTREFRIVLPDGAERWIASRGHVHPDANGKPFRMLGIAMDITERKGADERFRLAVEASPNGMVLVNEQGRIVLVNAQTEALFGYTRAELIGQPVGLLVPEQYRGVHPGHVHGFLAGTQKRAMGAGSELFALRKDGTEFPVEIGLSPIQSAEGQLVLSAIVDVSSRRQAEAEVLRQRDELAHLSRVAMLGELSGSMAHELNQPLTAILSNAQAAQRFLGNEPIDLNEVREILADIVAADKHAGDIIHRLRVLFKKEEVRHLPLDVNTMVLDILKLIHHELAGKDVLVQLELAPDLPVVDGDGVQLQQVMLNLVMNGCDAMAGMPRDARRLWVQTEACAEHTIRIAITDAGPGLDPDNLEKIFEPFYTTKPQGLGLGLAVCRTIIASHGGTMRATNSPERGATIEVSLPVRDGGSR